MLLALLLLTVFSQGCKNTEVPFPSKKLSQFNINGSHFSYEYTPTGIEIYLTNPLKCPIRYTIKPSDTAFENAFKPIASVVVPALGDTTVSLELPEGSKPAMNFGVFLGDPNRTVTKEKVGLPIKVNSPTRIIQGYDGLHSHNLNFSRYAIDFAMDIGDTIYAAEDGIVIGLIKDYKHGGEDPKWKGYDNFITLYHPESGLYTQYAHLIYNGSLVQTGDTVERYQPIALAGMTGYTDIAHLHFNTLIPVNSTDGLLSTPISFLEGLEGASLKRDDLVERK